MRQKIHVNNLPELTTFRRELRANLTPAEAHIWNVVKGRQFDGRKFRRQHSVGRYVLDFYCASERLAVELDGHVHFSDTAILHDYERKLFLEFFGINVMRFENKWVFEYLEYVLARIRMEFGWRQRTTTPSAEAAATPPLEGGELLIYNL